MTEMLPASPGGIAALARKFTWDGNHLEPGIALALSGGGFRAMLFHAGALARLNELGILSKVARISSVSGGSIAAGYLAFVWNRLGVPNASGAFDQFQQTYVDAILSFSRKQIDVGDFVAGLTPWSSAAKQIVASYDQLLFHNTTLQQIPDKPQFVFCATNLRTGVLFRFTKPYAGDYIVGRMAKPDLSLSTAVAASSAFPPFFSPLVLEPPEGSFTDWPGQPAKETGPAAPNPLRARIPLSDGGVYDNHGLEPIVKRFMTLLVSDGGAPFSRDHDVPHDPIRQLQRVFAVADGQVRALRRRDLMSRFRASKTLRPAQTDRYARFGTYWGIDTAPSNVTPNEALPCDETTVNFLAHLPTRLSDLGDTLSKQLVNWGYAICDRCVRVHCSESVVQPESKPRWPYPEAPLD